MSEDREYWFTLERRLSDSEAKVSQLQRDYQRDITELSHSVKHITGRVNEGLSNSVHAVENDNLKIKLAHSELRHDLESAVSEMRGFVNNSTDLTKLMVQNFGEKDLKPVKEEMSMMKKTFIYGIVLGVIALITNKTMGTLWEKVFHKENPPHVLVVPN